MTKTDIFAEALADGLPLKEAAAKVGWTRSQGNSAFQRIRAMLGAQAV